MLQAKSVDSAGSAMSRPTLVKKDERPPVVLRHLLTNGATVAITPELAHRIILECGYERQRGVRPLHVSALAMQMRRKEWTPGTQLHFARMMADGWLRLVDGQHRLHAVVEANTAVAFQILLTDCKNETDVARVYRRHDRLAIHRTIVDTLAASGIYEKHEIHRQLGRYVWGAALLIEARLESGLSTKADPYLVRSDEARLALCEPWWGYAAHFQEAVSKAPAKVRARLYSQGPLAVALLTLRDQKAKADAFWRGLANNDGLRRDDPRSAYLRQIFIERQKTAFITAKAASVAWNAFFADEKLQIIRVTNSPIRVAGVRLGE